MSYPLAPATTGAPLIDAGMAGLIGTILVAVIAGVFSILLKRARGPADILAAQKAADEAAAILADKERDREAAKEAGYREAAEFVKASAESAIETYQTQISELSAVIGLITASLSQQERLAEQARNLSLTERAGYQTTIDALRGRITALEGQITNLDNLVRAQRMKIDVLEGRRPILTDDLEHEFQTIPPSELDALRASVQLGTSTKENPIV